MKIRNGFVSNSSSSSFIIPLYKITDDQKNQIYNHVEIAKEIDDLLKIKGKPIIYQYYEKWDIKEDDFSIWCFTTMDNFCLSEFVINEVGLNYNDLIFIGDGDWFFNLYEDEKYKKMKIDFLRNKKINKLKGKT